MAAGLLADLDRAVAFQGIALNTSTLTNGIISGCRIDLFDVSAVQVRQFTEPLALAQGLDVGGVWLGGRTGKIAGTVYGLTRGAAFDAIAALEAAMDPTQIYTATPSSFGYAPLTWYAIQAGGGSVLRTLNIRPDGLLVTVRREWFGGPDGAPLAIPWSVQFLAKNPVIA